MIRNCRRLVGWVLVLALLLGIAPMGIALESGYADVNGHWAAEDIAVWSRRGVVRGSGGLFRPDDSITRAEMAQVVANLLALSGDGENPFPDVAENAWYAKAVLQCAAAGVMKGDGTSFRPDALITRQEAMVVLARALYYARGDARGLTGFPDGGQVAEWARDLVAALIASDVVHGDQKGFLRPERNIGRAEVTAILNRAVSVYINAGGEYTLKPEETAGVVLVAAADVTLSGQASGRIVVTQGAEKGAVKLKNVTVSELVVAAQDATVDLSGKTKVGKLVVPEEVLSAEINVNYGSEIGRVDAGENITINRPAVISSTTTDGGSGGGSSGGDRPEPSPEPSVEPSPEPSPEPGPEDSFVLFDGDQVPDIYVSTEDHKQVTRVVQDLQKDVERVTTKVPEIRNVAGDLSELAIIVGSVDQSPVIQKLMETGKLDEAKELQGKWESYLLKIVDEPLEGVKQALVIAGSDKRGTVYGVYDLSEQIGVSPWYYWGDIAPQVKDKIVLTQALKVEGEPSVKYRGIFINDEQNLVQWATDNGPDKSDDFRNLGPETYAKVYELLLRLKANYLWPGMHSETRLGQGVYDGSHYNATDYFNKYPENRELADEYGIVVGTSHCEPMMRNGTAEWGEFLQKEGYLTDVDFKSVVGKNKIDNWMYDYNKNNPNKPPIPRYDYSESDEQRAFIDKYWNESVEAYKDYEVSYTLGMRGIHDTGFRTAALSGSDTQGKLRVLQSVIDSQVKMMEDNEVSDEAISIFIPYKEVLPLYEAGLRLPDDTIIVWAEDNHGHIRRFPTAEENQRAGGSGVYYHLSYEGTHSYQWMNSTPPALIVSEMSKAYDSGIQKLWVLNVGDIKPSEIGAELFLEMAWDIDRWNEENLMDPEEGFLNQVAKKWFPDADSRVVGEMLREYYHLNYSRKPEHTNKGDAVFDPEHYGDESMQRLADYQDLAAKAMAVMEALAAKDDYQADAFYEIVAYPIFGAYINNLKFYHNQKNALCLQQGRTAAANLHATMVDWAAEQERKAAEYYNTGAFDGKWDKMMQLNNFLRTSTITPMVTAPEQKDVAYVSALGVAAEGTDNVLDFSAYLRNTRYLDVFNQGGKPFGYTVEADQSWIRISEPSGTIYDEQRLFVDIDWDALPDGDQSGVITVTGEGTGTRTVRVRVSNPAMKRESISGYAEADGYVAIEAEHFTENHGDGEVGFTVFDGLARSGGAVTAGPMGSQRYTDLANAPYLTYQVYFQSAGTFPTTIYRVPSLDGVGQRLALGIDDGEPVVVAGENKDETSTWKVSVVNGIEKKTTNMTIPSAGYHTVKLYMIDPGVSVDRIVINTGGELRSNQGPRESYHSVYNPDPSWTPKLLSMEEPALEAIVAEVEDKIAVLGDGADADFLRSEVEAVCATLDNKEDDTVRRGAARLRSALLRVAAQEDVDGLLAEARTQAENAAKANDGGGVVPYQPEAMSAFQTTLAGILEKLDSGAELSAAEKLECYEGLMSAMLELKNHRAVTVRGVSSVQQPNLADHAADGDAATRWAASSTNFPQWIELDLGDIYDLSQISITWYNNDAKNRSYRYTVEASLDGESYRQVVDRSQNTDKGTVSDSITGSGRYVRVNVSGSYNGSSASGNASIYEIKLTGSKADMAAPEKLQELAEAAENARGELDELNAETYTVDSYALFRDAVVAAEALTGESIVPTQAVDEALAALTAGKNALTERDEPMVEKTFDALSGKEDLSADGWTVLEDSGDVTLENDNGNKYLKIAQTEEKKEQGKGKSVGVLFDVGPYTSGKVYIQARVRSDNPKAFYGCPYVHQNNGAVQNNAILTSLAMRDGDEQSGLWKASNQKNGSGVTTVGEGFQAGQWYTITIVLDADNPTKGQVYIDGEHVGKDLTMRTDMTQLGMLRFYSDDKELSRGMAIGYLDDLVIYREKAGEAAPDELEQVSAALSEKADAAAALLDDAEDYTIDSLTALKTAEANARTELAKDAESVSLAGLEKCTGALAAAMDALKAKDIKLSENFDAAAVRDDLLTSGWSFVEDVGTVTLEEDSDNKYLKIEQTQKEKGKSVAAISSFTGLTGKLYIQMKVRSDAPGTMYAAPLIYKDVDTIMNGGAILGGVQLRNGGEVCTYTTQGKPTTAPAEGAAFQANKWHNIVLIVSENHDQMEIYFDGAKVGKDSYPMRNVETSIGALRFYSDDNDSSRAMAIGYLDDLVVYQEAVTQ